MSVKHSVLIVFCDATSFDFSLLSNHDVNVVFVLQPVKTPDNKTIYRLSVVTRSGVVVEGLEPIPGFLGGDNLSREYLLSKCK